MFASRPRTAGTVEKIANAMPEWRNKPHPSISDYYKGARLRSGKPVYQQNNHSNVVFGDDRIAVRKSLAQEVDHETNHEVCHTLKANHLKLIQMSFEERQEYYQNAQRVVGESALDAMEHMMRGKLNQRTASGPSQLRRNFKYFDRDASGDIDLDEFMFALGLMGLNFNENQMIALFARYDRTISGTFDYQDFCDVLMEYDFGSIATTTTGSKLQKMMAAVFDIDNTTTRSSFSTRSSTNSSDEEFAATTMPSPTDVRHVRRVFNMLDRDGNGTLDILEIEELLHALGIENISQDQLRRGMRRLDTDGNNKVDFDEFYEWYNSALNV